jgi:hypothetical protein
VLKMCRIGLLTLHGEDNFQPVLVQFCEVVVRNENASLSDSARLSSFGDNFT